MYGIVGEHDSDVATLTVLVRRLARDKSLRVKGEGCRGCGKMLRKGAGALRAFRDMGCTHFIVCHDADGPDPGPNGKKVREKIVRPSGVGDACCVLIPIQELEAWILADIECATKIFTSWKPPPIPNPEAIVKPKEHLEKLSRDGKQRPRYSHARDNEKMAEHLDLEKVRNKCKAFGVLCDFVARNLAAR